MTVTFDDYIAEREVRDPEFRRVREGSRPLFEFQNSLTDARLRAGLTLRQLAERAGIRQEAAWRLEQGAYFPRIETIRRLALALDVEVVVTSQGAVQVRRPTEAHSAAVGTARGPASESPANAEPFASASKRHG